MNYLVIDFETGGFDYNTCAITQVALIILEGKSLIQLNEYNSYITPYDKEYEQGALTATNISLDKLKKEGKDAKIVAKELEAILSRYASRSNKDKLIWVGHNPLFDIGFFNVFMKQFSKQSIDKYFTGKPFDNFFIPDNIDTILLARIAFERETMSSASYKLQSVCERLGVELTDAHDAMNDTVATKNVFNIFANKLKEKVINKDKTLIEAGFTSQSTTPLGNRFRSTFEI